MVKLVKTFGLGPKDSESSNLSTCIVLCTGNLVVEYEFAEFKTGVRFSLGAM